jgi:hypothetical protein
MSEPRNANGKWVVIVLLAAGVIAAIAGVKFRNLSERPDGATTQRSPNDPR